MLEVIGGENCCDGEREWAFEIGENPGVREQFTLKNLAVFCPTNYTYPETPDCTESTKLMKVSPIDTSGYLDQGVMVIW